MSVLDKTVQVIDVLGRSGSSMRLGDLAQELSLPKSSLHRVLADLTTHGLVRRAGEGRYALGYRLVQWGHLADGSIGIRPVAEPVMTRLRDEFGESVHLYVPEGDHRVCVVSVEGPHTLRPVAILGSPLPLGYGAAGKVLYSHAPPAVRDRVAAAGADPRHGRPLPTEAERAAIRSAGFAVSVSEMEPGLCAVSTPITGPGGTVLGALSVASSESRLSAARIEEIQPRLRQSASDIGAALSG